MALTASEEALVRQLLDQQAAILSLAGNEATITSKLGATKVTLADLVAASGVADADLLLMRQGTTDKSVTPLLLKSYTSPSASETVVGIVELATSSETIAGTDAQRAVHPAGLSAALALNTNPAGSIIYIAKNTAPTGYLKANGALVSRTTYAALFAAIGTTFGAGDGSTTFALPDLRGEFMRGWDDGRGADSGRAFGSAQTDDFKSHAHQSPLGTEIAVAGTNNRMTTGSAFGFGLNTSSSGGTETRPRNIALLACIKY